MTERIAFIGSGNIARRIITGLIKSGLEQERVVVSDRSRESLNELCTLYPKVVPARSNREAVTGAKIIMLCVKPGDVRNVCEEIASIMKGVLVSVAAGITSARLSDWSGDHRAIVRCMPNIPISVRQGVVGLYAIPEVSTDERDDIQNLFAKAAATFWLDKESLMNSITALSGSGPGYFLALAEDFEILAREGGLADVEQFAGDVLFHGAKIVEYSIHQPTDKPVQSCVEYLDENGLSKDEHQRMLYITCLGCLSAFCEGLKKAAVQAGFTEPTAAEMVRTTLSGSAALAKSEGGVKQLYTQVASKGGTTEQGIKVIKEANLQQVLMTDTHQDGDLSIGQKCAGMEQLAKRVFEAARDRANTLEAEMAD